MTDAGTNKLLAIFKNFFKTSNRWTVKDASAMRVNHTGGGEEAMRNLLGPSSRFVARRDFTDTLASALIAFHSNLHEEFIMGTHELSRYPRRHEFTSILKAAGLSLAIATIAYVGVTLLQHAGPLLTAASGFMLEGQMVNLEPSADSVDAQRASGAATAAVPAASTPKPVTRDFDYFPDHYVNQATKNEQPVATF